MVSTERWLMVGLFVYVGGCFFFVTSSFKKVLKKSGLVGIMECRARTLFYQRIGCA